MIWGKENCQEGCGASSRSRPMLCCIISTRDLTEARRSYSKLPPSIDGVFCHKDIGSIEVSLAHEETLSLSIPSFSAVGGWKARNNSRDQLACSCAWFPGAWSWVFLEADWTNNVPRIFFGTQTTRFHFAVDMLWGVSSVVWWFGESVTLLMLRWLLHLILSN